MKERAPRPADGLLHPVALLALVLLGLNDHLLKARWPGPITGKLSDLAGMVCFPLVLVALKELVFPGPAPFRPSRRALRVACATTGVGFALVKTWIFAGAIWAWTWGALQWPLLALVALAHGRGIPPLMPVALVRDPTDLVALPLVFLALWVGGRRAGEPEAPTPGRNSGDTPG